MRVSLVDKIDIDAVLEMNKRKTTDFKNPAKIIEEPDSPIEDSEDAVKIEKESELIN